MPLVGKERMNAMFPLHGEGAGKECLPMRSLVQTENGVNEPRASVEDSSVLALFHSFVQNFKRTIEQAPTAATRIFVVHEGQSITGTEAVFDQHFKQWKRDTGASSDIAKIITHPSYYRIIALGERALPFVFKSLQEGTGPWFVALDAMTAHIQSAPYRPVFRASARQLREEWLDWGRKHGFLHAESADVRCEAV
jgi:hypothetical protein